MYLSKNSRYVLQKAQFLSPSFLKGVEKNLSVKTPKDDPSKPPLRINIPDGSPKAAGPGQNAASINPVVEDDFIPSSESEIQHFSKFTVDDILVDCASDPKPKTPKRAVLVSPGEVESAGDTQQKDYSEGLQTALQDTVTEEALGDNYYKAAESAENGKSDEVEQALERLHESEGVIDPKTLYIIIDVPESSEEKRLSAEDVKKDTNSSFFQEKSNSSEKSLAQNLERKSRSLSRFSTYKNVTPRVLRNNLQVHELADANTYIFQLKMGKGHKGLVRVPERDIRTRHGDDKTDGPIKVRVNNAPTHPVRKQVMVVEELPETIRYDGRWLMDADDGRGVKRFKSEEVKKSDGSGNAQEEEKAEGDAATQAQPEEPAYPPRRAKREEKIAVNAFVQDDFGSIRNGIKNYPFKVPIKRPEKKSEVEAVPEEAIIEGIKHHLYDDIVTQKWWQNDPIAESKVTIDTTTPKKDEVGPPTKEGSEGAELGSKMKEETPITSVTQSPSSPAANESSKYVNIHEIMPEKPEDDPPQRFKFREDKHEKFSPPQKRPPPETSNVENSSAYCSIDELTPEPPRKGKKHTPEKKGRFNPKKPNQPSKFNKLSQQAEIKKAADNEAADFHTSASCLTISCESASPGLTNFGSALPPLLNEALKNRFRLRNEQPVSDKWKNEEGKGQKGCSLEQNSILFPEKRADDVDNEALFVDKDALISKLIKNERETSPKKPKTGDNQDGETAAPVDTLTVMKKVKEIVQFDLNNAVKIFNDGDVCPGKEQSSVVILKGEHDWEVDRKDLARHVEMRKNEMQTAAAATICPPEHNNASNMGDESPLPFYLPPKGEKPEAMILQDYCLNSVVTLDKKTNKFFVQEETLKKAISERTQDTFGEVNNILKLTADENVKRRKNGDSILVFDVDTQTWKVDFSILEKRKQQQQLEEELTKRSEAILETFERLEKEHFSTVPKPNSKEKKTFDYKKEEWKAYDSKNKVSKSKLPFKKSNPEEIRKKNSDLFENMFDGKKKTAKNPESNFDPSKQPKFCSSKQMDPPGANPPKGHGSPPQPTKQDPKTPPAKPPKEEDHFWESFLKIHTPPRAIKEPPVKIPPPKPQQPPLPKDLPRPLPPSLKTPPKIEEPKPEMVKKKIEEPKFRISLPFIRDRKNDKKKQTEKGPKVEKKPTTTDRAAPSAKIEKKDPAPKAKAPPPSPTVQKGDPPAGGTKKPPPMIGAPVRSPPSVGSPSVVKVQEPKTGSGKSEKIASASDHYVSDKIIEISRNKNADHQAKIKTNKVETVKLNITSDTRMPSKITEINLNKKCDEKGKEPMKQPPPDGSSSKAVIPYPQGSGRKLNKHLENFKTPFSDPDFEEKSMKIKPDLESNPNLRKLDNWNKTLVLHDIMKPPENLESWLKDETDKMATLLLKVLQEAGDAKTKKKLPGGKTKDKFPGKATSHDHLRKRQKTLPENFFFKVQTMNLSPGSDKKTKPDDFKLTGKADSSKEAAKAKSLNELKLPSTSMEANLDDKKFKIEIETTSTISKKFPLEITDDVPGPAILKKISGAWKVIPVIGSQLTISSLFGLFKLVNLGTSLLDGGKPEKCRSYSFEKLFRRYGPVVNVQGPLSGNVVLLHKPEHINAVFDQDAPIRSVFDSLEQSRKDFEEKSTPAVISTDWYKQEWNYLRRGTNDPIFKGLEMYFGGTNAAADSLVYVIRKNRNAQNLVSEDFMQEIKRWSLEGLCNVLYEKSFGYLEGRIGTDAWILEPEKLFTAMDEATNCLNKCEMGFQSWRIINTPTTLALAESFRTISSIISKQLNQADVNLKNKGELVRNGSFIGKTDLTFIESMLLNDGLTPSEIICNLTDIMLIGANMMNSALGFLLYNLAQNVQTQKKLFGELKEALPGKNSQLNYNQLDSLRYLQACLKESLRLHIPVPIFYRLLQNDILVANYVIPKGTYIVMDYGLSSMREQNFLEAEKFLPERWLDDEKCFYSAHPFATFPFCHGPKGDLIKRVVEMQLLAGIAKIIRNFEIEYHYEDIRATETLIALPDKPLKLNFVERDS